MSKRDLLPFDRGTSGTGHGNYAGEQFDHVPFDPSAGAVASARTGGDVTLLCVKNSSGITLEPKRLVKFKDGTNYTEVDGYATTTGKYPVAVVDEFCTGGVPNADYFFVVIGGPTLMLTDLAGADNNVISEGDPLIALTAATSQATTSGRVYTLPGAGASTHLGTNLLGVFAYALSAKTTANTNADILGHLLRRL